MTDRDSPARKELRTQLALDASHGVIGKSSMRMCFARDPSISFDAGFAICKFSVLPPKIAAVDIQCFWTNM